MPKRVNIWRSLHRWKAVFSVYIFVKKFLGKIKSYIWYLHLKYKKRHRLFIDTNRYYLCHQYADCREQVALILHLYWVILVNLIKDCMSKVYHFLLRSQNFTSWEQSNSSKRKKVAGSLLSQIPKKKKK